VIGWGYEYIIKQVNMVMKESDNRICHFTRAGKKIQKA